MVMCQAVLNIHAILYFLQDAQSYADDNSLLFMETSAKTSMNVNEIFMAIGKWLLTYYLLIWPLIMLHITLC